MKLLRGQGFFITSFIITTTTVVSVSFTEYDWVYKTFCTVGDFTTPILRLLWQNHYVWNVHDQWVMIE